MSGFEDKTGMIESVGPEATEPLLAALDVVEEESLHVTGAYEVEPMQKRIAFNGFRHVSDEYRRSRHHRLDLIRDTGMIGAKPSATFAETA